MKKTALWKDSLREIKQTLARFLSLLGIIILGAGFFVGIRAAAPNMLNTSGQYYAEQGLQEISIQSTYGLRSEDTAILDSIEDVSYLPYQSVDREVEGSKQLFKVMPNFNEMGDINQFEVMSGKLPEQKNEIALASSINTDPENPTYQVGDTISFTATGVEEVNTNSTEQPPHLTADSFEVVGFVRSPLYIDKTSYGYTNIGKGTLDGYGVVHPDAIQGDIMTSIAVSVDEADQYQAYTEGYDKIVSDKLAEIEQAFADRPAQIQENLQAEIDSGYDDIDQARSELESAGNQLVAANSQIEEGQANLDDQRSVVEQSLPAGVTLEQAGMLGLESQFQVGSSSLDAASESLTEAEQTYQSESESANTTMADAEADLKTTQADINALESPTYLIDDRSSLAGYSEYGDNADRISAIAQVFPLVFFLVAALVSFTTMSRMVDEQRTQIGTLKALGYRPSEIAMKFVIYALLACLTGVVVGVLIGNYMFPNIIYYAYGMMYDLPDMVQGYYWDDILLALAISLLTTVAPAMLTMHRSLGENAAQLMRPKPPKQGGKIFLERINWLWRRLGFQSKITLRNLFRYKGRNMMTLIGIAGSAALIITGFGISNSISGLADRQFATVQQSDMVVSYNNTAEPAQKDELAKGYASNEGLANYLDLYTTTYHTVDESINQQDVSLNVIAGNQPYHEFYAFADVETGESHDLPQDGALVTQKIAKLLGLQVGDSMALENDDGEAIEIRVAGITENYMMHNVFMTPEYYEAVTSETAPAYNQTQLKTADMSAEASDQLATDLTADEAVAAVVFVEDMQATFNETLATLNMVTVVLIIAAAALAFIVLYSLTNINVSERIRELSTIKVLGFYPREVSLYIYRETLIITVFGILLGFVFGQGLTAYILSTVEVDYMVFPVEVAMTSYIYAALLTMLFSLIVMFFMHNKLKRVDMVEALKGVE